MTDFTIKIQFTITVSSLPARPPT